jgi:aminocarboxymuconate-semialdehyde decarboxylase
MAASSRFKIDLHTHLLPSKLPNLEEKYGYPGFVHLDHFAPGKCNMYQGGKFFRAVEENCYCCAARLPDMERTGVDVQVLSTVPVMFNYWAKPQDCYEISQLLNDDVAEAVKSDPKKFIGLGTIPMQAPDLAIQELRRCVVELGFAGVQIGTHVNEWNLDAPELFPIFEVCLAEVVHDINQSTIHTHTHTH